MSANSPAKHPTQRTLLHEIHTATSPKQDPTTLGRTLLLCCLFRTSGWHRHAAWRDHRHNRPSSRMVPVAKRKLQCQILKVALRRADLTACHLYNRLISEPKVATVFGRGRLTPCPDAATQVPAQRPDDPTHADTTPRGTRVQPNTDITPWPSRTLQLCTSYYHT